ncbi:MAG: NUDIX domain-containing protein [Tenuifilaceae bacterium]
MSYTYDYPRMLVTVDALIFLKDSLHPVPEILLIKRKNDPFKGQYALPGGFPESDELLKDAAKRELLEETGLNGIELSQLLAFDKIGRDPRDRNICVAFYGHTTAENSTVTGSDDAEQAGWYKINDLPPLAFDHTEIIDFARKKLGI